MYPPPGKGTRNNKNNNDKNKIREAGSNKNVVKTNILWKFYMKTS